MKLERQQTPERHGPPNVQVWDLGVRLLHAALALGAMATWLTGHWWHDAHEWLGYAVGAVVLLRLLWSRRSAPGGRFGHFVRGPRSVGAYVKALAAGRAARHLGHNPLAGWMVLALLAVCGALAVTGAMSVTDTFWGYEWLYLTHASLGWVLAVLVPLHWLGVAFTSAHQRENLVAAMLHGRKRAPRPGDVPP